MEKSEVMQEATALAREVLPTIQRLYNLIKSDYKQAIEPTIELTKQVLEPLERFEGVLLDNIGYAIYIASVDAASKEKPKWYEKLGQSGLYAHLIQIMNALYIAAKGLDNPGWKTSRLAMEIKRFKEVPLEESFPKRLMVFEEELREQV